MSESQRGKLERDVLAKKRELKRSQQEFREDFNLRRNGSSQAAAQIYQTIVQIAKEKNFDLVLGDGVIYGNERWTSPAKSWRLNATRPHRARLRP
jgi:outer membrane protein